MQEKNLQDYFSNGFELKEFSIKKGDGSIEKIKPNWKVLNSGSVNEVNSLFLKPLPFKLSKQFDEQSKLGISEALYFLIKEKLITSLQYPEGKIILEETPIFFCSSLYRIYLETFLLLELDLPTAQI